MHPSLHTSPIEKRSIVILGHKTSVSLESWAWRHFKRIAAARGQTLSELAGELDRSRWHRNLSAAIRRAVIEDLESAIASLLGPSAEASEILAGRGEVRLLAPLLPRASGAPAFAKASAGEAATPGHG